MTLDELRKEIEASAELEIDLDKESRKVPKLHSRAIGIKAMEMAILKALEIELDVRKRDRWVFYSGKAEPKAYKEEQFDLKVLKGDVDIFLHSDKKVNEIRSKIEVQKIKVAMVDEWLKSINQRTFLIKSSIDYQKLMNGLS